MLTDVSVVCREVGRARRSSTVALLWLLLTPAPGLAQPFPTASTAATLTVLGGSVDLQRGDGARAAAASGTSLSVGDRIVTGPDARALITFLDGTTVTVEPRSEITVREIDVGGRERSSIQILISAGTVWARIANVLGGRGTVSLASNTHAAIARDGLIGAESRPGGTFVCWTRAGTLQVVDLAGASQAVLQPGQKATIPGRGHAVTETFSVHRSVVEVVARGAAWPLVVMPDGVRLAGFVTPGIEVNQVFGSLTARPEAERWVVEVPGGLPGPYRVLLAGVMDGAFSVTVTGHVRGRAVYERKWTGRIAKGQRLAGGVVQDFDVRQTPPANEAETLRGMISPLRPDTGPAPGFVLLSPLEVAAAEGR
ncbi:MAG TPA: hypothetical protein VIE44_05150 [Methylomirabilota bacterium]|jgi:hypothetical protein